jgi:DNA polymerase III epsilon subunit-like protein
METWALIDTETDGLYAPIFAIEVAAQKFEGLKPVGYPFRVFINHGIDIPLEATAVHGYTTEFIVQNGLPPLEAYSQLREYIGGVPIVSHFLQFDWNRVLFHEFNRLQIEPIGKPSFCSWGLARRALPEHLTHRLDYLRDFYDLNCCRPHSALGDVEATTDLLQRVIFPRLKEIQYDSIQKIYEFATMRPILRCRCMVQRLDFEKEKLRIAQAEWEERYRAAEIERKNRIYETARSIPNLILEHELIDEEHDILFNGRKFLFTGKMVTGPRSLARKEIQKRGGITPTSNHLGDDIDYLVLGEDPEAGWLRLLHGGKLTSAFIKKFRNPSSRLHIIREDLLRAALMEAV